VSDTVIRNIQNQIASAKQRMEMNMQAGGNINIEGVEFLSVIDQSVKGV